MDIKRLHRLNFLHKNTCASTVSVAGYSNTQLKATLIKMLDLNFLCKLVILLGLAHQVIYAQTPAAPHWNYHNFKGWTEHTSACAGAHQSPINIKTSKSKGVNYSKFTFGNYKTILPEIVTNNGHTAQFNMDHVPVNKLPYVTGGGLNTRYIFEQMHFHWGSDSSRGSEHTIDGKAFPGELHMVHYNSKYGSFNKSVPHPDGIAVLGVLIQVKSKDNPVFFHLEQFDGVRKADATKSNHLAFPVPLFDLLPSNTDKFFRYNGSLTTPGCNEDVIWTVFEQPIDISEIQLRAFRSLHDDEGRSLTQNHRPVQDLHDRKVTHRIHKH